MSLQKMEKQFAAILLAACVSLSSPGMAVSESAPGTLPPGGDPWPRVVTAEGAMISIYQPQLESWNDNTLDAYSAVSVKVQGPKVTDYGVIWFKARTEVDKVNRVVTLDDFQLTRQNFPTLTNNGSAYAGVFRGQLPARRQHNDGATSIREAGAGVMVVMGSPTAGEVDGAEVDSTAAGGEAEDLATVGSTGVVLVAEVLEGSGGSQTGKALLA